MKSSLNVYRCLLVIVSAALCHVKVAQSQKPNSDHSSHTFAADSLPSVEHMLATALKNSPDVRAAQAELDRARLNVVQEIRAFREEWRDAFEVLGEVKTAQREVDRVSRLGEGAIPAKRLLEAREALTLAKSRAVAAEARLKELRLLLPHLVGHPIAARANNHDHPSHNHDAGHQHDHEAIAAPVKDLLDERLQLLTKIVELQHAAYRSGEVSFDEVATAQLDLMAAQLELATSTDQRLQVRQRMIQVSRQIEEATKQLFQANETTQTDMLKATALRLRAEADLKREQFSASHAH